MKGSHPAVIATRVAEASGFWGAFGGTLLMNLVTTGLFLGTNSLVARDLSGVLFLSGTATGHTIGGAETLGYVCLSAATSRLSIYGLRTSDGHRLMFGSERR